MGKPIYIMVEKEINAPLHSVWEQVAVGFGNVCQYHPEIEQSKFEGEIKQGIGMVRHCQPAGGGFLKEEIIEWNETESFKLKMIDTSFPMVMIESKFSFHGRANRTIVTQEFWYRMKSPMGWLSGLMKGKMRKTLENGLNGLEYYITTHKKIYNDK
ncbi:MAG: SRPBCC family protein [Saprospiraceae bacterium]